VEVGALHFVPLVGVFDDQCSSHAEGVIVSSRGVERSDTPGRRAIGPHAEGVLVGHASLIV